MVIIRNKNAGKFLIKAVNSKEKIYIFTNRSPNISNSHAEVFINRNKRVEKKEKNKSKKLFLNQLLPLQIKFVCFSRTLQYFPFGRFLVFKPEKCFICPIFLARPRHKRLFSLRGRQMCNQSFSNLCHAEKCFVTITRQTCVQNTKRI